MDADGVKEAIASFIEEWIPIMRLDHWDITYTWDETDDIATAHARPRYLRLGLAFNVPRIMSELDMRKSFNLEELVVHELCHALTWRLWDLVDQFTNSDKAWKFFTTDVHEEAVTNMGWALVNARRGIGSS